MATDIPGFAGRVSPVPGGWRTTPSSCGVRCWVGCPQAGVVPQKPALGGQLDLPEGQVLQGWGVLTTVAPLGMGQPIGRWTGLGT